MPRGVSDWLIDKSALVRLADSPDAGEWRTVPSAA